MFSQPDDPTLKILLEGKIDLHGEFMWGSNYTFLLEIEHPSGGRRGVYKPSRGVRPLWDFPSATLARREVAAFQVSEALGWELVPPTVFRRDGPYGPGSIQLYVEHDPEYHYFNFTPEDRQRLRPTALFDLLINNADRKGSHILIDPDQHLWLIDHGICFHVEDKLRTVVWDFAGEPIPENLCADLSTFHQSLQPVNGAPPPLAQQLRAYLSAGEVSALRQRAMALLAQGCFSDTPPNRRAYPWPPV
jgi:uncharacterized repeat protein (TIGR03843 family)